MVPGRRQRNSQNNMYESVQEVHKRLGLYGRIGGVNSGAEWMAKMKNIMLYRDALIVMQIFEIRGKWSDAMLELVTTSEEMCYMMALEDVQKLAEDTRAGLPISHPFSGIAL